ncbi:hypothetical protein [Paenibacillus kobensis]|nr:hypothetical protein [Paenibacillus kobensis]
MREDGDVDQGRLLAAFMRQGRIDRGTVRISFRVSNGGRAVVAERGG